MINSSTPSEKALLPINKRWLKNQAKDLKRKEGISHTQALDRLTQQHGYKNYSHYRKLNPEG